MIRVVIAEDDKDVRLSLINILETDPDISVVGEADDGLEAVKLARALLPDIMLMDIKMPGIDGLEAAKRVKALNCDKGKEIKILMLSTFYDDDFVLKSQEYGVDGYLLKGLAFSKLANAIKNAASGFVTLDRTIYEKQSKLAFGTITNNPELGTLTNNEVKILRLVVSGKTNSEIAAELFLSEGTVRNYVSSMLSKLGCKSSRDLVIFGIKAGL
ncbi:MAG: response regulator transcription factor [Clostridiales bacterium]|nr:response regulator transcription factor [Clostridiales bacterium]